jgi:hypothetical protein
MPSPLLACSNGDEGWGRGQPGVVDLDRGWRGSEVLTTFGSSGREKRKEEVHKKREENIKEVHGMWMVGLNPHGSRGKKRRG